MTLHIGLDPGVTGGIAIIDGARVVVVEKMPPTDREIYALLRDAVASHAAMAWLEHVHPMPRSMAGVIGAFKLGLSKGALRMALAAAAIPFNEVAPIRWQTAMACRTRGDKNVSKRRAQELFPSIKVTHAIADALLLAEYGRRREAAPEQRVRASEVLPW